MNPIAFIIRPLEGNLPLDGPEVFDNWSSAALKLRDLCGRDTGCRLYNKTEVIIQYDNGCWENRRFDAQRGVEGALKDIATFRASTLLWSRSRPEVPS